jgi:hypothetical protein
MTTFTEAWDKLPEELQTCDYFSETDYSTLLVHWSEATIDVLLSYDATVLHPYRRAVVLTTIPFAGMSTFLKYFGHMDAWKIECVDDRVEPPSFGSTPLISDDTFEIMNEAAEAKSCSLKCLHLSQMLKEDAHKFVDAFGLQLKELCLNNTPVPESIRWRSPLLEVLWVMYNGLHKGSELLDQYPYVNEIPIRPGMLSPRGMGGYPVPEYLKKYTLGSVKIGPKSLKTITLGKGLVGSCLTFLGLAEPIDASHGGIKSLQVFGGTPDPGYIKKYAHEVRHTKHMDLVCDHCEEEDKAYKPEQMFWNGVPMTCEEYKEKLRERMLTAMRQDKEYLEKYSPRERQFGERAGDEGFPYWSVSSVALLLAHTKFSSKNE